MTLTLFGALRGIPLLPGARCVGHHLLFDAEETTASSIAMAVQTCHQCPALAACREWVDGLPPAHKPAGVIAGIYREPKKTRK